MDVAALPTHLRVHPLAFKALSLLRHAAASEKCPPAHFNLSNCYYFGVGTSTGQPDPQLGAKALQEAARTGDALAAAAYAARLTLGTGGVARDPDAAARHWRVAAVAGHPAAMHNVGVAYAWPPSPATPRDVGAALPWLRRAAASGFVRSQVSLGLLLETAHPSCGIASDLEGAEAAYVAAEAGLQEAGGGGGAALDRVRGRLAAVRAARAAGRAAVEESRDAPDAVLPFDTEEERDAALAELARVAEPGGGVAPDALLEVLRQRFPGALSGASDEKGGRG